MLLDYGLARVADVILLVTAIDILLNQPFKYFNFFVIFLLELLTLVRSVT